MLKCLLVVFAGKRRMEGIMLVGRCDSLNKHLGRLIQRQACAIRSTSTGVGLNVNILIQ